MTSIMTSVVMSVLTPALCCDVYFDVCFDVVCCDVHYDVYCNVLQYMVMSMMPSVLTSWRCCDVCSDTCCDVFSDFCNEKLTDICHLRVRTISDECRDVILWRDGLALKDNCLGHNVIHIELIVALYGVWLKRTSADHLRIFLIFPLTSSYSCHEIAFLFLITLIL